MTLYKAICLTCFLTALLPAGTEALELCGKPAQGEILKGYAPGAEKFCLTAGNICFLRRETFCWPSAATKLRKKADSHQCQRHCQRLFPERYRDQMGYSGH